MKKKSAVDAEFAILRSFGRTLDGPERADLERSRINLWSAFEQQDAPTAERWFQAVYAAVVGCNGSAALKKVSLDALKVIARAIYDDPPEPER